MQNPVSIIFLILFGLTILLIYLAVRRGSLNVSTGAGVGVVANALFFTLYSLSQGNPFIYALVVGIVFGLLFTGLAVAMAAFFKSNASTPALPAAPDSPTEQLSNQRPE